MDIRDPVLLALLLAAIVFGVCAAAVMTLGGDLTPDYFDTAGKYIHQL